MMRSLVLTLGHNSSAVYVENGNVLGGYEEERFSGVKSDSSFPRKSIEALMSKYDIECFDNCYISHWFTAGIIFSNKYYDHEYVTEICNDVHSLDNGFTHHDAHMLSAKVFADRYHVPADRTYFVADGFGTYGECISIYQAKDGRTSLLRRVFGYQHSLGMLYQYATAYLGMKMHNHEYKMLGYEAHISKVLDVHQMHRLNGLIVAAARKRVKAMLEAEIDKDMDPIVNSAALAATSHAISEELDSVLVKMNFNSNNIDDVRVLISYYVQGVVECVMEALADLHQPVNLVVAGGLFYNVKLNHLLSQRCSTFCAMPLAGDQGAGLGVYEYYNGDLKWPAHVFWGHRDLTKIDAVEGIIKISDSDNLIEILDHELRTNRMVNLVRGSMEFGPRSLCNTATLALPQMDIVHEINHMNDRTSIMPMAPVMTADQAAYFLDDIDKVHGSLEYMIMTRTVKAERGQHIQGAAHEYPHLEITTCRPQITNDYVLRSLLNEHGPLINTSFNYHGVPIVHTAEDVVFSHTMQNRKHPIKTIVYVGE